MCLVWKVPIYTIQSTLQQTGLKLTGCCSERLKPPAPPLLTHSLSFLQLCFSLECETATVIMMVMMKMMREKRFPIENPSGGHTRRWVQRRGNKQKQNTQTPDTNTHKQTFISKYVSVAQTPQCTHCTTRELVCGRNDCNGKLNYEWGEKRKSIKCKCGWWWNFHLRNNKVKPRQNVQE